MRRRARLLIALLGLPLAAAQAQAPPTLDIYYLDVDGGGGHADRVAVRGITAHRRGLAGAARRRSAFWPRRGRRASIKSTTSSRRTITPIMSAPVAEVADSATDPQFRRPRRPGRGAAREQRRGVPAVRRNAGARQPHAREAGGYDSNCRHRGARGCLRGRIARGAVVRGWDAEPALRRVHAARGRDRERCGVGRVVHRLWAVPGDPAGRPDVQQGARAGLSDQCPGHGRRVPDERARFEPVESLASFSMRCGRAPPSSTTAAARALRAKRGHGCRRHPASRIFGRCTIPSCGLVATNGPRVRSRGARHFNVPEQFIANLGDSTGNFIRMSASADGSFTITNGRTGFKKEYAARSK